MHMLTPVSATTISQTVVCLRNSASGADATKCRELPADIGASPPGATDDSVSACAARRSPPSPARAAPAPRERLPTRNSALARRAEMRLGERCALATFRGAARRPRG